MKTPRWNAVFLALWLVGCASFGIVPSAFCQSAAASPPSYVGLIVTRTPQHAQAVLIQLRAGMDFGVLAKENSIDPSSDDGGYIGLLNSPQLPSAYRDALQGIGPGKFTKILHLPAGYGILSILSGPPKGPGLTAKQIHNLVTSAVGRQSINVAGMSEEDAAFAQYPKPANWQRDISEPCTIRKESHAAAVQHIQRVIELESQPGAQYAPIDRFRSHVTLAQLDTFVGDMHNAINEWQSAYRIAQSDIPGAVPYLQEALGVSYLHLSEMENGVYRDPGTIDIFPPVNLSDHFAKPKNTQIAIQYFLSFLKRAPDDIQVKWLLNLAYRYLGQYPAGVPAQYRIAPGYFQSKQDVGRFTDVARAAGLNVFSAAGGVIVDDFENNGRLDVITSSSDECDPLHYFHNNGDGTFTDRTAQAGLSDEFGGLNLIQADYNNDGCMDFLVLRGGWEFPMRMSLMRNNCDGTFTDVTEKSGLDAVIPQTQTAAWADIDNDGNLDLFVGNENAPSQLFHNNGDGTFKDISRSSGIDKVALTKGVVAADYDQDGYVDFYVSNFEGPNFLFHNNHNLTFTDVARQAGVQAPYLSFATWFFDYDNDGWPDLFVTSYYCFTVDQTIRSYLGLPFSAETEKLYRNMHNGTFKDVTAQVGLDKVFMPMGANFGDVDNDGFLDIYLGMGQPSFADLLPHVLLRNDGGRKFVDITASTGTGDLHKGHGIAFADLERDGHEDIVALIGGAVPSDKHVMRVFRNPGNDNDWINVRLIGVKSNRAAFGAEIKVTVQDDGGKPRSIYRTVGDTSSFGANPVEQHIGLGHGARITSLDVWWPATNTRQHFTNLQKDQFISIKEFETHYTKLDRHPVRIGVAETASAAD